MTAVLLYGAPGTGKTWSLATIAEAGWPLFALFLEPDGHHSLIASLEARGVSREAVHWAVRPPVTASRGDLKALATALGTRPLDSLLKSPLHAGREAARKRAIELVELLANFKCDCCGREWGPVDEFPARSAFALDSLTGLNDIAMGLVAGLSPVRSQPQWGAAIEFESQVITNLVRAFPGLFVLVAHAEREANELTGAVEVAPAALGRKAPHRIGREFSEVILAERQGGEFRWNLAPAMAVAKGRLLPLEGRLSPSFKPLIERLEALSANPAKEESK